MSALRQPSFPVESYPSRQYAQHGRLSPENRQKVKSTVAHPAKFPQTKRLPVKLQVLLLLQRGSLGLALISMATSLGLYLSTVPIPQLWSQEYKKLETLQRQERQLTEINETLKYQIARQSEVENSNLSIQQPNDAVFIPVSEVNVKTELDSAKSVRSNHMSTLRTIKLKHISLGY